MPFLFYCVKASDFLGFGIDATKHFLPPESEVA